MKKFFLIPLLTLVCSVMAWATDVANKTELQNALNAGGDITLTANISLGGAKVTMTSGTVTLDLNGHDLTGTLANYGTDKGVLNVSGGNLAINATGGGKIDNTSSNGCGIVTTGSAKVTINGGTFHGGYEGIYAAGGEVVVNDANFTKPGDNNIWLVGETGAKVTVNGGTFVGGWMCFQVDKGTELLINGGSFSKGDDIFYPGGIITVKGGTFDVNPWKYVSVPYYVGKADELFQVAHIGSNVAVADFVAYASLSAAVTAASDGAIISLFANDNNAITVSKNAVIETNGFTATGVSAGAEYGKFVVDGNIIISNNTLVTFLQGNESAKTLDANVSFAQKLVVNGTKELTIPAGITVSATYVKDACIVVPNGAKLTIYGDGTIAGDKELIRVLEGGELIIGHEDQSDCLKMTTTVWESVNYAVNNYGKTTINNAEVHAASAALNTYGVMNVNGGYYTGEAYYPNHRYCVTADDGSQLNIKNSRVFGIHGALACQGSAGSNIGGSARIENCELVATYQPYLTDFTAQNPACHYGIYSASGGIVSVYNTKMKHGPKQDHSIAIGNNDAWNTFGLVHVYEGCMLPNVSANKRIWVQKRSATDKEVLFPVTVDQNSGWYTAAMNGGDAPLPAGYVWKTIIAEGEPTENQVLDAAAYAEGYRWISVSTAEKQEDASGTTIPWQQNTTWTDTPTGDDVPDANTAVLIPEGKVVVVSKDEANKNAEADQIVIEGKNASLTVQDGTTLNVENGVNIADGGKLVVDAGAMVTIGAGGLVAGNEEAVEVKMTEEKSGIFMIAPSVTENTHPMAKVELVSKACYVPAEDRYIWQRFGVPAYMEGMTKANVDYDHDTYPTAWMKIEHQNWADFEDGDVFKPFTCYGLTTTNTNPGAVYTFTSALMGNGNAELDLADNWNYYANSYTAPINIPQMLADFKAAYPNVSGTVYLYRAYDNWWYEINNAAYAFGVDENDQPLPEQIAPMQAFIFQRRGEGENPEINYLSQIWNPIMNPSAGAPTRNNSSFNKAMIEIMAEDGTKDAIRLIEGSQFSADFDNSYDAAKYMKDNSFNLFADANDEKLGTIASDNLEGTTISMNTKGQTSFTMTIKHANGMNYAIRDMLTGTEVEMTEGATYMFSVPADANVEGRFQIVSVAKMPTAIDNIETTAAIKGIYTVNGQYVGNNYHILPKGVYVVDGKKIVK